MQNRRANAIKVDSRELERARRASLVAFQSDVALLEGTADEPVGCFGLRAERIKNSCGAERSGAATQFCVELSRVGITWSLRSV